MTRFKFLLNESEVKSIIDALRSRTSLIRKEAEKLDGNVKDIVISACVSDERLAAGLELELKELTCS